MDIPILQAQILQTNIAWMTFSVFANFLTFTQHNNNNNNNNKCFIFL